MWLSSCASTPSSSTRFIFSSSPVVTATAACFGLRPVDERVRRGVVDDVEPRLRQPARDAQALDEVVVARAYCCGSAGLRVRDRERDLVAVEVRDDRRDDHDDARRSRCRRRRPGAGSRTRRRPATSSSTKPEDEQNVLRLFAAICSYNENLGSTVRATGGRRPGSELDLAAPRSRPASALKYSRGLKLNMPAMMFDGNVWILLL